MADLEQPFGLIAEITVRGMTESVQPVRRPSRARQVALLS